MLAIETSRIASDGERQQAVSATIQVLRKRVNLSGIRFSLEPAGLDHVVLKVATSRERDLIGLRRLILRRGVLEFCLVQERSSLLGAEASAPACQVATVKRKLFNGGTEEEEVCLKRPPALTGGVKNATVLRDSLGQPEIAFVLADDAAQRFSRLTRDNIGRRLAIVVDGEVQAAPRIQSPIEQGSGVITGNFELSEAYQLAHMLEAPLPAPLRIVSEQSF